MVIAPTYAGKTVIGWAAALRMGFTRLLIVSPTSAIYKWQEATGGAYRLDRLTKKKRLELYEQIRNSEDHFAVIATPGTVRRDIKELRKLGFDLFLWDEAHVLYNRREQANKTQIFKAAKRLLTPRTIFLTQNKRGRGLYQFWSILNLRDKRFSSFWQFVNRYFAVYEDGFGKEIDGLRRDCLDDFKEAISPHIMIVPDTEVAPYLPEKCRDRLVVKPTRTEKRICDELWKYLLAEMGEDEVIAVQNDVTALTRMRQFNTCPGLLKPEMGVGSGLPAVVDHAQSIGENKIAIYCPYVEAFDFYEQYLKKRGYKHVFRISGQDTNADEVPIIARTFDEIPENTKSAVLLGIDFSVGYDINNCTTGYFLGFSWDHDDNMQAEGRLRGPDAPWVNFFYVFIEGGAYHQVWSKLEQKHRVTGVLDE